MWWTNDTMTLLTLLSRRASGPTYLDNVLALNPIAYWPLNETSGTNADNAQGNADRDGTYTGVVLNSVASPITGDNAPLFDGTSDFVDVNTASLNSVFNGSELTLSMWFKVSAAGVWSDSTYRRLYYLLVDGSNFLTLQKTNTTNQIQFAYSAAAVLENVVDTSLAGTTDWVHVAYTVSKANERTTPYINGSPITGTTTLGVWVGGAFSHARIGAQLGTPTQVWDGYLSHVAIFASELTAAQVTTLATAV